MTFLNWADLAPDMRPIPALLSLALFAGPAQAAQPIRLQVIPFQAGWGSRKLPVHEFKGTLLPPPALLPPPPATSTATRQRPPKRARNADWEWLMD